MTNPFRNPRNRILFAVALLITGLAGTKAFAEQYVRFYPAYEQREYVKTPAHIIAKMKEAGVVFLSDQPSLLPVDKLNEFDLLNSPSRPLNTRAKENIRKLIANGITEIGTLKLQTILDKMDQIQIRLTKWGVFTDSNSPLASHRRFAINIASANLIILNTPAWKIIDDSPFSDLLLTHEVLGALNIEDNNYTLTLLAWYLTRFPKRSQALLKEMKSISFEQIKNQMAGISVVGRGGDAAEVTFKVTMLESLKNVPPDGDLGKTSLSRIEMAILSSTIVRMPESFMLQNKLCLWVHDPRERIQDSRDSLGNQDRRSCAVFYKDQEKGYRIFLSNNWGESELAKEPHLFYAPTKALLMMPMVFQQEI